MQNKEKVMKSKKELFDQTGMSYLFTQLRLALTDLEVQMDFRSAKVTMSEQLPSPRVE